MLKNAVASFLLIASVALADFTFQTFPASNQILLTSQPLTVRWEVRAGYSPESPSQSAPPMLRIHLGSKDASGIPKIYWPPLNGEQNNIPLNQGYYQWNWNPTMFTETLPPRGQKGTGSQFFFQIQDGVGYISSGQPFYIRETTAPPSPVPASPAPPSTAPPSNAGSSTVVAPSDSTGSTTGNSNTGASTEAAPSDSTSTTTPTNANANRSGNGNDNPPNKPATDTTTFSPAAASTQNGGAGILSPQLVVAAAAVMASAASSML